MLYCIRRATPSYRTRTLLKEGRKVRVTYRDIVLSLYGGSAFSVMVTWWRRLAAIYINGVHAHMLQATSVYVVKILHMAMMVAS